jgi:phosphatidylglycerol:prolipoprotein diacylglycerol transferase
MQQHFVWDLDPQIFSSMPVPRWYGLFFAGGIVIGFLIMKNMFHAQKKDTMLVDRLLIYVFLGMLIGMRLGHCLFYQPETYLSDPLRILKFWEGGYASHGGFAGLIIAVFLFCRRHSEIQLLWLLDRIAVSSMIAAAAIRIGNFFNSEMIGRQSDGPWAIVFKAVDDLPRHPSQLYEAVGFLAVFTLGIITYKKANNNPKPGLLFGLVLVFGMGWRFVVEFSKENQVDFEAQLPLNMGQLLSIPFILAGVILILMTLMHRKTKSSPQLQVRQEHK